jgi:hypothetical protein
MRLILFLLLLFPLSLFAQKNNQATKVVLSACVQELCIAKSDKKSCGNCCYEKYRFTNYGSDDNRPKLQNQTADIKSDPSQEWDECIECCKTAFPDEKKSGKKRKDD